MYESPRFWILATVCFALSSAAYIFANGFLNLFSILNCILLVISVIELILTKRKNNKNSVKNKSKQSRK